MIEYRKILKFTYNKEKYQLLLDENNKYFFLKINNDGSFSYVDFKNIFGTDSRNEYVVKIGLPTNKENDNYYYEIISDKQRFFVYAAMQNVGLYKLQIFLDLSHLD